LLQLSLPFHHQGPDNAVIARGRFELRDLRWNDVELTDLVSGDVRLSRDGILVREVSGLVAGGQLRGVVGCRFKDWSRGWFDVRLSRAEASRFTSLVGGTGGFRGLAEEGKNLVSGPIDISLRGLLGPECQGSGSVLLARGKVVGVGVSDWRIPVEFTFAPGRGQGELTVRESSAQVGSGRAMLRLTANWNGQLRLEGRLQLFEASLQSLAGLLGDVSSFARGRVTGQMDFLGSDIHSVSDISASIRATLNDAQALQLPVLRQLVPYLVPGQPSVEFSRGELLGQLSGGVFRISELTLESALVRMLLQGSVVLRGSGASRLDLEVTAQTSKAGINPVLLRLLLRALPPVGPVPVGLVLRASDLLADRVLHFRISGTASAPVVVIEPIRLLSEQAVRFFLTRALRQGW
jgi:hypothetical protein